MTRRLDDFEARIAQELFQGFRMDPEATARAVFALMWHRLDFNEIAKVVAELPLPLRALWPEAAQSLAQARAGE